MKQKRRLLSFILVICLLAGLVPATAFAVTVRTSRSSRTNVGAGGAVQIPGSSNPSGGIQGYDSVSGAYHYIYFGEWDGVPIKWRVLDTKVNDSAGSGLFLLSEAALEQVEFSEAAPKTTDWDGSAAQKWCQNFAKSTLDSGKGGFSEGEAKVILPSSADGLNSDGVFFLSGAEVTESNYGFSKEETEKDSVRKAGSIAGSTDVSWWLRSASQSSGSPSDPLVDTVSDEGNLSSQNLDTDNECYARPAFNLDMSKVLFTAPATGGGPARDAGGLKKVPTEAPSEWRLVLKDDGLNSSPSGSFTAEPVSGTASPIEVNTENGKISIAYEHARTGNNEYISAMLIDKNDKVLYYGQIEECTADSGEVEIQVPSDLATDTYWLRVFNEQYAGSNRTGYAGGFSNAIEIKVTDTTPPVLTKIEGNRISGTEVELIFTSSEAGDCYYKVVSKGTTVSAGDIETSGTGIQIPADEQQKLVLDILEEGKEQDVYLVVKDADGNVSNLLAFEFSADIDPVYSISVIPDSLDFGVEEEGYGELASEEIEIKNTGNQTITVKELVAAGEYLLTDSFSETSLAAGDSVKFAVRPRNGLTAGKYPGTVTVSYEGAGGTLEEAEILLSFEVVEEARYSISVDPEVLDFESAAEGYAQPEAKPVTIRNTGNQVVRLTKSTKTENYDDRAFSVSSLSETSLEPGRTASFTVQPKAGLSKGTYSETITISGNRRIDDATAKVDVSFTVTDAQVSSGKYTISVENVGEGGSITPSSIEVDEGGDAVFTVVPDAGYEVGQVLVDGTEDVTEQLSDAGKYTFEHVTENHTISASFKAAGGDLAPVTHRVTVSAAPETGGTVTGGGTYNEGSSVMVTAAANAGYRFVRWTENGSQVSDSASYRFGLTADRTLTAVFEAEEETPAPVSHTVTVTSSYAGQSGAGTYETGATVTIQAGTRGNYRFDGWTSEDGITFANANSATTTFTMPDKDVAVAAKWTYTGSTGTNNGTNTGTNTGGTSGNTNTTSTGTGTAPDGKGGTYTGDDTPTAMWVFVFCTSLGIMTVLSVLGWRGRNPYSEFVGQWKGLTEKEFGQKKK